jgi:hypothetical protein
MADCIVVTSTWYAYGLVGFCDRPRGGGAVGPATARHGVVVEGHMCLGPWVFGRGVLQWIHFTAELVFQPWLPRWTTLVSLVARCTGAVSKSTQVVITVKECLLRPYVCVCVCVCARACAC